MAPLAAFVAVVGAGSFSKAARRSGIDKSLLSRRVQALEAALGRRLLQRTTRTLSVTLEGRALYDRVALPLHDTLEALVMAHAPGQVQGVVRIATFPILAAEVWVPIVRELRATYGDLVLDIRADERGFVDLIDGRFDLALRTGSLPDSSLVGRRIATWRYVLCASPSWLARHRSLQAPHELANHWLLYADVPDSTRWRFERRRALAEVEVRPLLSTDNSHVMLSALRAGLGVSALPPFVVKDELLTKRLVRVLPRWRVAHCHPIWLVFPGRAYTPARVSVVERAVEARVRSLGAEWATLTE